MQMVFQLSGAVGEGCPLTVNAALQIVQPQKNVIAPDELGLGMGFCMFFKLRQKDCCHRHKHGFIFRIKTMSTIILVVNQMGKTIFGNYTYIFKATGFPPYIF